MTSDGTAAGGMRKWDASASADPPGFFVACRMTGTPRAASRAAASSPSGSYWARPAELESRATPAGPQAAAAPATAAAPAGVRVEE
jgi:hypothetical protein